MSARLTVFFAGVGSFAVGNIVLAATSRQFANEHENFIGLAMLLGFALIGISIWMWKEDFGGPSEKIATQTETRSMASVISETLQPHKPDLPPPNQPSPHTSPVKGIMRVDITQTPQTVDVYITLSEQAKFLVNNNHLGSVPIEQNFEKLSEHMADFRRLLSSVYDETDANIAGQLSGDDLEYWKKTNAEWRAEEKARQPHEIKNEEQRYKEQNTVYLRDYLQNPYRKIVDNPLQASQYLKRLETDYLPKIKATLETAAPSQTKSYEF